jgi:hypothetical protein
MGMWGCRRFLTRPPVPPSKLSVPKALFALSWFPSPDLRDVFTQYPEEAIYEIGSSVVMR